MKYSSLENKKTSNILDITLFIIWPFAAFLISFINGFKSKNDTIVLFLSSIFIGFCFAIDNQSADIHSYLRDFQYYNNVSLNDFINNVVFKYFTFNSIHSDIGMDAIYFVTSRFTLNPKALIVSLSIIFGLVYSKVIHNFTKHRMRQGILTYLLISLLVLLIFPTQAINQRFWIAGMFFVYGVQKYIQHNNNVGLLWILMSPIMHIGLSLFVIGLVLYRVTLFIPQYLILLFIPIALLLSINLLDNIGPIINLVGGAAENKFANYAGEIGEALKTNLNSRVWYAVYWREMTLISFSSLLVYIFIDCKSNNSTFYKFVRLIIYLLILVLLLRQFSMSFRYFELLIFLEIGIVFFYTQKFTLRSSFKLLFFGQTPVFLLVLFLKISAILQYIQLKYFISNPLSVLFFEESKNVWSFIDFIN